MEWYGQSLAWQEKSLGKEHRDTLATLRSMGNVFLAVEDYTSAIQCYEWVYAGLEEHPDTLAAPARMAIGCDWQGYFDKATEYFNRALTGLESSLGQEHPHILAVLNNMAAVFIEQQDYDKSMERLIELKRSFRKDHPKPSRFSVTWQLYIPTNGSTTMQWSASAVPCWNGTISRGRTS
jgi:tetratricopeptide (TPR) repeat protein